MQMFLQNVYVLLCVICADVPTECICSLVLFMQMFLQNVYVLLCVIYADVPTECICSRIKVSDSANDCNVHELKACLHNIITAIFQCTMNVIFQDLLWKKLPAYLDNVGVMGKNLSDTLKNGYVYLHYFILLFVISYFVYVRNACVLRLYSMVDIFNVWGTCLVEYILVKILSVHAILCCNWAISAGHINMCVSERH